MAFAHLQPIVFEALRESALAPVDVAAIDSGIDGTHPALSGRVVAAHRSTRLEDGSYRAEPVRHPGNFDDHGHGTAVAGIIAAIAPNARIHDFRIFAAGDPAPGEGTLACLDAAIGSGARIINMSLAIKPKFAHRLYELLEAAHQARALVVASQRNLPITDFGHPAQLSYCIGVDLHGRPSPYEIGFRRGHAIPFLARGERIAAPAPGGKTTVVTGTSFATSTVSGLCALLLGASPELESYEIKAILKAQACQID